MLVSLYLLIILVNLPWFLYLLLKLVNLPVVFSANMSCYPPQTHFPSENVTLEWNDALSAFLAVRFANLTEIAIPAFAVSYLFFFGIGGSLHVSREI
jgi:hypothetical protein